MDWPSSDLGTMIRENRQLVTDEPVEFETQTQTQPVEVQDCRKIADHLRGIYRILSNLIKENRRMSTYNRLDLQTLGSQPTMPKNLPDHCLGLGTWNPVRSGKIPTFIFSMAKIAWIDLKWLGTWDPRKVVKSQPSCSQWLRLHGLTSSDLGLGTWDLCDRP